MRIFLKYLSCGCLVAISLAVYEIFTTKLLGAGPCLVLSFLTAGAPTSCDSLYHIARLYLYLLPNYSTLQVVDGGHFVGVYTNLQEK